MKWIAKVAWVAGIFYICAGLHVSAEPIGSDSGNANQRGYFDDIFGMPLAAADGTAIRLIPSEGGMTREIADGDGVVSRTVFSFYDDQTGRVSGEGDAASEMGRFRMTSNEIDIRYANGHSEIMKQSSSGGLLLIAKTPGGDVRCRVWFPQGHSFSADDRKTNAVRNPDCADVTVSQIVEAHTEAKAEAPLAVPAMPPSKISVNVRAAHGVLAPLQPISLGTSAIHTIDQAVLPNPVVAGGVAVVIHRASFRIPAAPVDDVPAISNPAACLSVESDGTHWGFRNRCAFDIQFAYCVASGSDQLTSCADGAVTGSVAPRGFGALTADRSLGEKSPDHDFRWIACNGGAGEVVPRMDHSDPPAGRCLRSNAS